MPYDPNATMLRAYYDAVPPVPMQAIRDRVDALRRRQAAKWSSVAVALIALILFAFAPSVQTHQSAPVTVPAPQPTIT